jgi:signal transduction histidine kinase
VSLTLGLYLESDKRTVDHESDTETEALRRRIVELEAKNEELEAFARTVAHDLKGPIGNVAGYADFLRSACTSLNRDELQEHLEAIRGSALKLGDIIDELLLLAELRQGKADIAQLDMASIVDRALQRVADRIEGDGATVVLPETWPPAVGYAPWIEEVWVNYVENAIKYGGCPAHVELSAERVSGFSHFGVRDNGRGLAPGEQDLLFAPFTRLDQVHIQGYGLGLSIVRYIVEKLGGEVGVESKLGQGSVFSFTLPAQGQSDPAGDTDEYGGRTKVSTGVRQRVSLGGPHVSRLQLEGESGAKLGDSQRIVP